MASVVGLNKVFILDKYFTEVSGCFDYDFSNSSDSNFMYSS